MRVQRRRTATDVRGDCSPSRNVCAVLGVQLASCPDQLDRAFVRIVRCTACNTPRLHGALSLSLRDGPFSSRAAAHQGRTLTRYVRTPITCPYPAEMIPNAPRLQLPSAVGLIEVYSRTACGRGSRSKGSAMARVESNSDLAIDISVANGVNEEYAQFPPVRAVGAASSRTMRPPSWSPPLPLHRVPVPPPGPASRSVSTRPAPMMPSSTPHRQSSRPMPLPAVTRSTMRPVSAALPSAAIFPRRGGSRFRWVLALAALSFAGGVVARDKAPTNLMDRARSEATFYTNWIADRIATLRGMTWTGSPASRQPSAAPSVEAMGPGATATGMPSTASHPASAGLQPGPPAPPEVNVLSLPIASPTAPAPKPVARAPVAVAPPATPAPAVHARSAPASTVADNAEASPEPAPRATEAPKVAAPAAAPASSAAPFVPGSLEDLIRKEVEKEQKKAH